MTFKRSFNKFREVFFLPNHVDGTDGNFRFIKRHHHGSTGTKLEGHIKRASLTSMTVFGLCHIVTKQIPLYFNIEFRMKAVARTFSCSKTSDYNVNRYILLSRAAYKSKIFLHQLLTNRNRLEFSTYAS